MNLPNIKDARKRNEVIDCVYLSDSNINKIYEGKKFFLRTYGCQMNVHDSEQIRDIVTKLGFSETDNYEESDLVILNTCAIRENVHDKVFGFLGRLKHLKKTKKDLIVSICGCMAQEEVVASVSSGLSFISGHAGCTAVNSFGTPRTDSKNNPLCNSSSSSGYN